MATLGMTIIGGENLRKENFLEKGIGLIFIITSAFLILLCSYRMSKAFPYSQKIKICESKISSINHQLAKELEKIEDFN
jgi:hypothetical protein